jgi:ATP-dependent DNA helicase RecG
MTREELLELIAAVQRFQSEVDDVEVKAAGQGTPQRLYESLSAFANRPGGGVILLGLDENLTFQVVGVRDAHRIIEETSNLAAEGMEPALRPEFTLAEVEGKPVVAIEVFEVALEQKPCFYKAAGLQSGAYIRVGNTNRQMSGYEVFSYLSARAQPVFDAEPVGEAVLEDLDRERLEEYIRKLRRARLDAPYLNRSFDELLKQLRIVREVDGALQPTLGGLLMFGVYPQTFEPQLVITFLHYYGIDEAERTPRGERFLDNRKFEGSIPDMVEAAVNYVMASIRKSSLIEGLLRRDIPEYPEEAVREAVVNAVAHRDYSPYVRGSYIQIRLLADRLEVQSPGGLYGNVTEETLEEEQSTRNRVLMRLMEDAHLVENRGSGIRAMLDAMRRLNLQPPRFQDRRSSFLVTFRNHTLMGPEAIAWLNRFADRPLNDRQRLALVYLRYNAQLTNSDYQRLNRVDPVTAGRELRGLVQAGLLGQHRTRRWAYYTIASEVARADAALVPFSDEERIMAYLKEHDSINNAECRDLLQVQIQRASNLLRKMHKQRLLKRDGERRWARYTLP